MTTTTSIPVTPVTGAVAVSGITAEGLTPSSEAMKAASGCSVGAKYTVVAEAGEVVLVGVDMDQP
jgi:hypothetical protein